MSSIFTTPAFRVQMKGLEPPQDYSYSVLNATRLPVPPHLLVDQIIPEFERLVVVGVCFVLELTSVIKIKPLFVVLFTVFVDLIGFGILIPVIPQLLANPHSTYYLLVGKGITISQGYIILGYLTAMFPFMQFLFTPILGQLSDHFGRKPLLAYSLLGTCLSYILFALGIVFKNIPLLFVARGFDGITGGNISVAQAAIADLTAPQDRAKNFGLMGAVFGIGFVLGPYIGGKLSDPTILPWFNATTPFWFAAFLSLVNVFSVWKFFPETHLNRDMTFSVTWDQSFLNIVSAFKPVRLRALFGTIFTFWAGFSFFTTFFSVYLIHRFGFTSSNIGDFFSYVGIWIAISQALIVRKLSGRFSEYQILCVSLAGAGLFLFLYALPTHWWYLLFITPFFAMFQGMTQANMTSLVSKAGENARGGILGINASVQALAQSIPPVLSGYIAAKLDPSASVHTSAFVVLLAAVVFIVFYRESKVKPASSASVYTASH